MLKLYGLEASNYYKMAKLALLEKGFEFDGVPVSPNQEQSFLSMSPMGKVPCLETREGFLSETMAIMEFLEDINSEVPLFPEGSFERAKVRELMRVCELYIELPASRLNTMASIPGANKEQVINEIKPEITKGLTALSRLAKFEPYLAGHLFTYADIVAYHTFSFAEKVMKNVCGWNVMSEVEGLVEWQKTVASRPIVHHMDRSNA
ncbi:MAG: glutathione S-transferase family protein [Porticoccus sp.]